MHETCIVNVEGAITRAGRYLMIVRGEEEAHAAGTLSLVGGKLELAETGEGVLEATLRREALEEVGVEIAPDPAYVKSSVFVLDDGTPVLDVVFLCRHLAGEPSICAPGEVAALRWMTADEVQADPLAPPWTRESIIRAEQARVRLGW